MLDAAHQGYIYQDVLGAYFVAQELARGKEITRFHFDYKKTPKGISDKFDDLVIYREEATSYIQVKYSSDEHQHILTKRDFSSRAAYDLALFDLFETWKALHNPGDDWRVCLAWDKPSSDDPIQAVLIELPNSECLLPGTTCYKFNCDALWPEHHDILASWRALREWSKSNDRNEFKEFLDCLIVEVDCPKSTLLQNYSQQLEKLLARAIETIGVGVYPNDHLSVRQVAESLCTIVKRRRATNSTIPISADEIARDINIIQTYGGVEQKFPVDMNVLVSTPERLEQVVSILEEHRTVILTAEPGAGKSWFIENLQQHLEGTTQVVKHYCYIALDDPLALKRITINVLYGSLITQILKSDESLGNFMPKRYASNLEQLNILLGKIKKKTLLIIDGIDHIWRVYQKNRGGLTEDEIQIIEALVQLDSTNPNLFILVISQPIDQLEPLKSFYHCTLAKLPEIFVVNLLEKQALLNTKVEGVSLAQTIHKKSNGNALYCKYLIDHAVINKAHSSFEWVDALPPYDFNLTSYYEYLYEQIQGDTRVPNALCGADFSVTETELQEITHLGNLVSKQLIPLRPILKYTPALGYSLYHESFKRFVIDMIRSQGASIDELVYRPLVVWLESHSFFESTKAYGHLLKLYYEIDAHNAIAQTISVDFIDESLYYAQPFNHIKQNHNLQKAALQKVNGFVQMIIVAEQAKIVYELEHNITDKVLVNYLKAVQVIHGDDAMYRVLWDGEDLLVSINDALRFLAFQAYQGKEIVHWSIIPGIANIPYEIIGLIAVKLINTKRFDEFDLFIKDVYEDPKHRKAFDRIIDEIEWLCIHVGDDWTKNTPHFQKILAELIPSAKTLEQAVDNIISNNKFVYDDNWESGMRELVALAKLASDEEIEKVTNVLSQYNWFRNWLIYLIKITVLSQRGCSDKEIVEAFTYLVRDLEPFKGKPRACDLYTQLPFIKKSFHRGLLLCEGNHEPLNRCCELLEKVTDLTTSIQRSFTGPLTDEEYLELITSYMPGDYVASKYEEYYGPLGTRRVYANVAEIAFEYAHVLSNAGRYLDAKEKYREGIQALTAYGFRKDRTLSEVLYSSVPYHQVYGTLEVEWFFELYHMAMTVVMHTDGRSTSNYPVEWFEEFIKVYPNEALMFLVSETYENQEASWHQEDEFHFVLGEYASLFSPTQWFLLCKSLPLASSDKILEHGLEVFDRVDDTIRDVYSRWLQSLPFIAKVDEGWTYSQEVVSQFEQKFGILLKPKEESRKTQNDSFATEASSSSVLPAASIDDALAFLELHGLKEEHAANLKQLLATITDVGEQKAILRQAAKSFRYDRHNIGRWVDEIFEVDTYEWLYFSVCLFVYIPDGWFHGLYDTNYIKRAYKVNSAETVNVLKEILGYYISNDDYPSLISCNLINALSELHVEETIVRELLQAIFQIVKRRLPHPPNLEINVAMYQRLDSLNRDEIVVAILIARLKTLTTEKTQGIIWSLTFIAQTAPETLFKAYSWAFFHQAYLLPIHRAVLLQILQEHVDQNLIPDELIGQLISNYPTGYFLEDQYIRSFVEYRIELDQNSATPILFAAHKYDHGFFPYIHPKYRKLAENLGSLEGTYNAYKYRRDKISEEYESYLLRSDGVVTPIVPHANAEYEIVNSQYYGSLKDLTKRFHPSYSCNLQFYLAEIVLQVGALARRPSYLPTPGNFPVFEVLDTVSPYKYDNWVMLASQENELFGEQFKPKSHRSSSCVLTFTEPAPGNEFYAQYLFRAGQYLSDIDNAPFDQPICTLTIMDTLERSNIIYVSPFIIKELGLEVDFVLHNGFQARNSKGEVIVRLIGWKDDYYGSISDGAEVPRLEGSAVVMRADYYEKLLALYQNEGHIILIQNDNDA